MAAPHTVGRRDRRRRENRERLLAAALRVMLARGYERASIAEIAEAADLGFGTFYSHFRSKQAVFDAIVEAGSARRFAALESALDGVDDVAERLAIGVAVHVALAAAEPEWTRFLLDARRQVENPGEAVVIAYTRANVERGCAEGRFRVHDVRAAVASVAGVVRSLVDVVASEPEGPAAAIRSAASSCLRVVGVDPQEADALGAQAALRASKHVA